MDDFFLIKINHAHLRKNIERYETSIFLHQLKKKFFFGGGEGHKQMAGLIKVYKETHFSCGNGTSFSFKHILTIFTLKDIRLRFCN